MITLLWLLSYSFESMYKSCNIQIYINLKIWLSVIQPFPFFNVYNQGPFSTSCAVKILLYSVYVLYENVECIIKISTVHKKILTYHPEKNLNFWPEWWSIYTKRHFGQKSRFHHERFRYIMKGRYFVINSRDILWQIFMMTGLDFHDGK